ncbi:SAM-dependent methyltransferase [Streptacidiphilus sp. PAMC 29251]
MDDAAREVLRAVQVAAGLGAGRRGAGAAGLLRWCAGELGARVQLVAADQVRGVEVAGVAGAEVEQLVRGRVPGPLVGDGAAVVVVPCFVGAGTGGALVAERRGAPFTTAEVEALETVAGGMGLLGWAAGVASREERLSGAAAGVRVAALQQLMAGDLVRAGRTVEPLVPGLLAAGAGTVAIVEGATGETRAGLAVEVEVAVADAGLVVLCPVSDRQVIVVYPAGRGMLEALLEPVCGRAPGRAAGLSTVTPWHSTSTAYEAAVAALARARGGTRGAAPRPAGAAGQVCVHDGRPPLTERLGADARMWAALALQPLDVLPDSERDALLHLAQQTLWWGPEGGARLVGMHRDTLTDRLGELFARLGADRGALWQRAGVYLAVRMAGLPLPMMLDRRVSLPEILDHPGARAWAAEILGPISGLRGGATILRSAAAWVTADFRPEPAMAELGVARETLYRRLRKAGAAAHLDILSYPGPRLELALALAIAGQVRISDLPTPARRLDRLTPGRPVPLDDASIDTSQPHTARMYDYFLGGRTNFAADRQAAERVLHDAPYTVTSARENRSYMHRAVRVLARTGIDQFLDVGSGIPISPNLHEIAQARNPAARVVYVDNDPIVLAHARALPASSKQGATDYAEADLRDGAALLSLPAVRGTLDLSRPVALSLHAVLHFVIGDSGYDLVRDLAAPLAPGSCLSITHGTADFDPEVVGAVIAHYNRAGQSVMVRDKVQMQAFADRIGRPAEILEPGIVGVPLWRPDPGTDVAPPPYHAYAMLIRLL